MKKQIILLPFCLLFLVLVTSVKAETTDASAALIHVSAELGAEPEPQTQTITLPPPRSALPNTGEKSESGLFLLGILCLSGSVGIFAKKCRKL